MHTGLSIILLWRAGAIFLLVGALLGALLGLLLIFWPRFLERVNRVANRWISLRYISRFLDRSISIERWFYRNHRPMGLLIILGAGYILGYFGWQFDRVHALKHLTGYLPVRLMGGLLDALVLMLLLGAALALLTGFIVGLRPSLLRSVEKGANQWVSLRRVTKGLDVPRDHVDVFIGRHAQRAGWPLLLGSTYLFFAMFRFLV